MSRRKLVWMASGAVIVLVVAISIILIIPRPSQETEAASSEEEPSEETEGEPTSGSESPWMKIAGWKLTLTVTGKGSWEDFYPDGMGQRGTYLARYAASVVLTNPVPMPDDSADPSDTSQFFSPDFYKRQMMWGSIAVLPGMPATGVPGVQPQPAEFSAEFDQQAVRKTSDVCGEGEGIGTALVTSTETSKGKVQEEGGSIAHAQLVVNIAKGTYGFEVSGGVGGHVEKKVETEGGCAGRGVRTGTIPET